MKRQINFAWKNLKFCLEKYYSLKWPACLKKSTASIIQVRYTYIWKVSNAAVLSFAHTFRISITYAAACTSSSNSWSVSISSHNKRHKLISRHELRRHVELNRIRPKNATCMQTASDPITWIDKYGFVGAGRSRRMPVGDRNTTNTLVARVVGIVMVRSGVRNVRYWAESFRIERRPGIWVTLSMAHIAVLLLLSRLLHSSRRHVNRTFGSTRRTSVFDSFDRWASFR